MSIQDPTIDETLSFWFETAGPARWYAASPAFDARVGRLFARAIETNARIWWEGGHPWEDTAFGSFALILQFDQFTRNVWRGSGHAFAHDEIARQIAWQMIWQGFDWAIPDDRRAFVYLPFMHSEEIEDQDLCVELTTERLSGTGTRDHAIKHREVIRQFGRFPYRNDALGRTSTAVEIAYLESGGYAPGRKHA
jgi:uncharacterized protein (DUF924 family)